MKRVMGRGGGWFGYLGEMVGMEKVWGVVGLDERERGRVVKGKGLEYGGEV